ASGAQHLCEHAALAGCARQIPPLGVAHYAERVQRRGTGRAVAESRAGSAAGFRSGVHRGGPEFPVRSIHRHHRGKGVMKFASLSVFFPAYNDAPSLPALVRTAFDVLREHVEDYELIVVNDGSWDKTAEVLEALRVEFAPYMRVVTHEQNRGYGGALRSGFAADTKDYVCYTDGDGQYDVSELPRLLEL